MYIARLSLICLIAFVFMVGCGLIGKQAEMTEEATMTADMKTDGDMMEAAVEEITLNVTGMT